jgi:hypothetical protein
VSRPHHRATRDVEATIDDAHTPTNTNTEPSGDNNTSKNQYNSKQLGKSLHTSKTTP